MWNLREYSEHDVPLFTAADLLAFRWRTRRAPKIAAPDTVLICYQRDALATVLRRRRAVRVRGFHGELQVVKIQDHILGLLHPPGPGAPLMALAVEELAAFGVRRFISLGLAGSLQPELQAGDVVIGDRALRAEGTSYHYLPPARWVAADPDLVQTIGAALTARQVAHTIGASWTTDAPYREMRRDVAAYCAEGVKTVEMEAAALFAVGQCLKLATAAVFVIGDRLTELTWQPPPDARWLRHPLGTVAEAIVAGVSAI